MSFTIGQPVSPTEIPGSKRGRSASTSQYNELIEMLYNKFVEEGGLEGSIERNKVEIDFLNVELDGTVGHQSLVTQVRKLVRKRFPDLNLEARNDYERDGSGNVIKESFTSERTGKTTERPIVNGVFLRITKEFWDNRGRKKTETPEPSASDESQDDSNSDTSSQEDVTRIE